MYKVIPKCSYTPARARILELLHSTHPKTGAPWTHSEIAGIVDRSRERVRQIAFEELGETGRQRQTVCTRLRQVHRKATTPVRPVRGILSVQILRKHFALISCSYCGRCHHVVPLSKMGSNARRCLACLAAVRLRWYYEHDGKEKASKWRQEHPEQVKAANQRHQAKKKAARVRERPQ